uniref:Reverse transcriptase zinc-binding domain-containing protein n=1 Tax=Arion vulgaris TaxID=1028688 RepID=A0A0B7BXP7_9EUPU
MENSRKSSRICNVESIFQFRTNHTGLNSHLNRLNSTHPPHCRHCNYVNETLHYTLLECPGPQVTEPKSLHSG